MKKKALALLLAVLCAAALSVPAFADGTTTLTTTVPSATYTMTIPEDCTVDYGTTSKEIGSVKVVPVDGFETGKNVKVTVSHTDFTCEGVATTIPFSLTAKSSVTYTVYSGYSSANKNYQPFKEASGGSFLFKSNGTNLLYVQTEDEGTGTGGYANEGYYSITVEMNHADWGKALAGTYTGSITFTSEIVAAE